jgi:predicted ribosome quality control (RQC) complex YloA/Tae2 family protein
MNDLASTAAMTYFKTQKGFEGKSAFYCWTCSFKANGTYLKGHLVADAEQKTFGVLLTDSKPESLTPTGGVVAQLRKYAKSPTIGRILKDTATGDWWLELFIGPSETPDFWFHLQAGKPPELSLIDKNNLIYIRKSSQGTFTKKKKLEGKLPDPSSPGFKLMNAALIADFLANTSQSKSAESNDNDKSDVLTDPTVADVLSDPQVLPDFQREARDRLARRLKTIRKAREKISSPEDLNAQIKRAEKEADLIKTWLHLLHEGDHILDLSFLPETDTDIRHIDVDPEKSPGGNLEALFQKVKKLKKTASVGFKMFQDLSLEVKAMEDDLHRLRTQRMDLRATEQILQRHKLAAKKVANSKTSTPVHAPWRTFTFNDSGRLIPFFVGKSAADNDELCKKARSNDTWMHAVGVTGSHVIIPAKTAGQSLSADLIKTAGILALHFSKVRDDLRGEVYISKRQHIRKQKGMAPGLWSVDKADSIFIKYDQDELQSALNLGAP